MYYFASAETSANNNLLEKDNVEIFWKEKVSACV